MKNQLVKSLLIASVLVFNLSAMAEDIDLFVGPPASATDLPNLMIVLDNAAGFSASASGASCIIDGSANSLAGTAGGIEQCAIYNVITGIKPLEDDAVDKPIVNIGMMMYNAGNIKDINNANCGGTYGGCLVQPLVPLNKANKAKFLAWVKSWRTSGGAGAGYVKASGQATAAAMQETWAYFSGHTGISDRSYAGIKPAAGCQNNYVVFVGSAYGANGTPGDSSSGGGPEDSLKGLLTGGNSDKNANPVASTLQKTLILNSVKTSCGNFTFKSAAHQNNGFYADEWARYMKGQNITTYTVGVINDKCQASYAGLLTSMAAAENGGGKYYPTDDYTTLVAAFQNILSQIQSVDSVFSSVSLPVSVNTQGTFLNQVYIGMFRPDQGSRPRWYGNLKQYKLGFIGNVLQLVDADDDSAISADGEGFIHECARSFWTPTTLDSYWAFKPKSNCEVVVSSAVSNSPDGNVVEKGAQAFQLRKAANVTGRNVKTCDSTCSNLANFNTSNNALQTKLGLTVTNADERDVLINWQRGLDVVPSVPTASATVAVPSTAGVDGDENENGVTLTEMRPSAHGDVVHSRPVAVDHRANPSDSPQVVVYYGSNDGMLHAINGNRSADIGSTKAGGELWSFVAPEFYSKIKRIRDNTITISFPSNLATSPTPLPKDYGVDGAITAYQYSGNTWVYATMRRGGRAVYAFDVTTPASPSLKWKIGCPNTGNDAGCTSPFPTDDFTGLGQTWSSPKVMKASGYGSGTSPMLIMGGGYDNCQDADPNTSCNSTNKGNRVYVMDADTGKLLKSFTTISSVIADVTVVTDSNGLAKYAYVADLGGNIYRISGTTANTPIGTSAPSGWTMTKIAAFGGTAVDNRKFMFAPDWVENGGTYTLLLGSGDREKPLSTYSAAVAVKNRFYVLNDKPADAAWLTSENSNCDANVMCENSLYAITSSATPTAAELAAKKGWFLALNSTEQVVTSAITVFDTLTFSTHQPTLPVSNACTTLGTARVYNLDYKNGKSTVGFVRGEIIAGGGLPPSPVAGMVTLDNGKTVPFIIGAKAESPLQGGTPKVPTSAKRPKSRVYWNIKK